MTTDSDPGAGQRFGRIVDRQPLGSGPHRVTSTYLVRDDDSHEIHSFDYSNIVTEGFRTVIVGERVRFEINPQTGRAHFVIRLDLPEVDEFYR
jgi:hypothetical protein